MKTNAYSVYDIVSKSYSLPIFMGDPEDLPAIEQEHLQAIRYFKNLVNINEQIRLNPNDFTLYYIGEFDDKECIFYNCAGDEPLPIAKAVDYLEVKDELQK